MRDAGLIDQTSTQAHTSTHVVAIAKHCTANTVALFRPFLRAWWTGQGRQKGAEMQRNSNGQAPRTPHHTTTRRQAPAANRSANSPWGRPQPGDARTGEGRSTTGICSGFVITPAGEWYLSTTTVRERESHCVAKCVLRYDRLALALKSLHRIVQ